MAGVLVSTAPLSAWGQVAAVKRAERASMARFIASTNQSPPTNDPPRAVQRQRAPAAVETERAVLPVPLLPTKLEWVAPPSGAPDPWVLFDGHADTALPPATEPVQLRVGLEAPSQLGALAVLGPAHGTITVRAEDSTGNHPIAGWTEIAIDLKAGEWKRVPTSASDRTQRLVVEWTGRSSGPSELGFWGFDVPRSHGAIDPELADRILAGASPSALTAAATPAEARIARVELGADAPRRPAEGFAFHAQLGPDPRSLARAFLVYELSGLGHWTEAVRQINGLEVRGGLAPSSAATRLASEGGLQVEEISPAWLHQGDNELRFLPPTASGSLGYSVRNVRVVGIAHAGLLETRISAMTGGAARGQIAFEQPSRPHEAVFDLRRPTDGQLVFRADSGRGAPVRVALHGLAAGWQHVDLETLPVTASVGVTLSTPITRRLQEGGDPSPVVGDVAVTESPRDVGDRRMVTTYPLHGECIDHKAEVRGFVEVPSTDRVTELRVSGRAAEGSLGRDGSFSLTQPESDAARGQKWDVPLEAQLASGAVLRSTIHMAPCLDAPKPSDGTLKEDDGAPYAQVVRAAEPTTLSFAGTELEIPAGAVDQDVRVTVRPLVADQVPEMSPGIGNVSPNGGAFRMGPHGLKFKKPIKITLPYDKHSLALGTNEREVFSFFYNEQHGKWERIGRFGSAQDGVLTSLTDHFTDFINATLAMPSEAGPQSFNPNDMKGIKLADPGAGLDLIAPPTANSSGTANLSLPLELPPGRNGMQPNLAFTYSSGAGNGWLGMGWDLHISAFEIDTRFGVPHYPDDGSQRYLLDGEQLTPTPNDINQYVRRVEGRFDKIQRNVDTNGCVTGWIVTDKNGTVSQYGGAGATLADPGNACSAFRWGLTSVTDTFNNGMNVTYLPDSGNNGDAWVELYPDTIRYTTSTNTSDLDVYRVEFFRDAPNTRSDVLITGRPGFQRQTRQRLDHVDVVYHDKTVNQNQDQIIRRYQVTYAAPSAQHFYKSLVQSIALFGQNAATQLDAHTFEYSAAPSSDNGMTLDAFAPPVDWGLVQTSAGVGRLDDGLSRTYQEDTGVTVSGGIGFPFGNISLSAGASTGTNDNQLTLIDFNGDGLPDPIDQNGNLNLNLLNPSLSIANPWPRHLQYASVSLPWTSPFAHNSQAGWNVGVTSTAAIFSDGADYTRRSSDDDKIVADIDGDGFPDLVMISNGVLTWYKNDGVGHFSLGGTTTSLAGSVAPPGGSAYMQASGDTGLRRIAPLIRWTAPLAGSIAITNPIQKIAKGGNGVVASIYQDNGTLLWQHTIHQDDLSACQPSGIDGCNGGILTTNVSPGSRIYFTVAPYDDGSGDTLEMAREAVRNDVSWAPSVTYQTGDLTQREPYGPPIYSFAQAADFRLAGKPDITWQASSSGDVVITGDITKASTSDNVSVRVLQQGAIAFSHAFGAGPDTLSISIPLTVTAQDNIDIQVVSDTPIDPGAIRWQPQITYHSYCKADPAQNQPVCGAITSCTTTGCAIANDPSPDNPIPLTVITQDLQPEFLLTGGPSGPMAGPLGLPQLLPPTPTPSYVAKSSGTVTVSGTITINPTGSPDSAYVLVQGVNALFSKTSVPLATTSNPVTLSVAVPVNAGDQIFVTVYSDDNIQFAVSWNNLTANGTPMTPNIRWRDTNFEVSPPTCTTCIPTDPMSGGFHRWFTGFINAELPFAESSIIFPNKLDGTLIQNIPPFNFALPQWQGAPSVPTTGIAPPIWAGPAGTYIAAGQLGTTRGGLGGTSNSLRSSTTWDVDLHANISYGGNGLSGTLDRGETFSTNDLFDFNGDRYPDSVTPAGVQFGDGKGNFADLANNPQPQPIHNLPDALRHIQHRTVNANASVSSSVVAAIVNEVTSLGSVLGSLPLQFSAGVSYSMAMNQADWIDVNGDGLPDYVTRDQNSAGQFNVQLNYGYALSKPIPWTTAAWNNQTITGGQVALATTSVLDFNSPVGVDQVRVEDSQTNNAGIGAGGGNGSIGGSGGVGFAYGSTRSLVDLIDVNGDGLPDQVMKNANDTSKRGMLFVRLNRGDKFGDEVVWNLPLWNNDANIGFDHDVAYAGHGDVDDPLSYRRSRIYNVNLSFNVCFFVCFGASAYHSWGNGWQHSSFEDVDGDGYVDQVLKVSGGDPSSGRDHLYVKLNQTGKTNLLTAVHRPLGGTIGLDYARVGNLVRLDLEPTTPNIDMPTNHWVMSTVDVDDHRGNHYVHAINYDPSGFHDRVEREDYGFAKVQTTREDQSTVEVDYFNHDFYRHGAVAQTIEADKNGNLFESRQFTYATSGLPSCSVAPCVGNFFPAEIERTTAYYEGTTTNLSAPGASTRETRTWDMKVGNLTDMTDFGDVGSADDVLYHVDYDPTLAAQYIFRPKEVTAKDTLGNVLRDRQATYDAFGGLKTLTNIVSGGNDPSGSPYVGMASTWAFQRDAYGNITQAVDPRGYTIDLVYDDIAQTYHVKTTDSFGYNSLSSPNYQFGTVASVTDVNGNMEVHSYDAFGRPKAVYAPSDIGSSEPTIAFDYSEDGSNPLPAFATTSHKDVQHPGDPIVTVTFADGLERIIQTKKDIAYDTGTGTLVGMTVSGAITFDARGRVHQRGQPVFDNTPATSFLNNVPMKNPTTLGYDILDRTVSTETPDGALTTIAYGFDTLDGTTRRATTVRDPNVNAGGLPGQPQETFSDVRGSVLAVQQQNHLGTAGLTTLLTRYAYDPLEELLSVSDAKGNVTTAQYDTLGRMVALNSPDAGLTTYSYDLSGNLAVRQTAKLRAQSQSIRYEYDFNRLRQITYPTSTPVVYKYGDFSEQGDVFFNRAGRIKEEDSEAGTKTYQYDELGDVVEQHWSLNSIAHDKTVEQDIGYDYDAFGRLLQIHFPDAELVSYGYDAGGNVTSAVGVDSQANTTPYVLQVGYDEFEQRTRLVSGNGIQTSYSYDPLTRRLSQINASTTARQFQAMRYQYDPAGNIDQIQNLAPYDDKMKGQVLVGPMTQNFTYDDLYQLKTADGLYQESSKQQFNYGLSLTYDAIGNILTKQQTSNQVALNNGGKVTPQQGQTYSSSYQYTGPRPHAPTEVDETPLSPNKPLARTLSYDPSGNQTGWSMQTDTRTVAWNEEDRITSITDNGSNNMQALYDGAGDRAVRLHDAGGEAETFYFGPNLTSRDGAAPSKQVFLGTQRVASKEAPANKGNQPPSVFYFHDDHLGSTNFLTDATQNLASHEEYFPTGELWRDETSDPLHVQTPYLFTGKELDVATGLYYFGARYYDPHLGIWASPDPALAEFMQNPESGILNPGHLGLYTYVLNNPVRYQDPRGLLELPFPVVLIPFVVVVGAVAYYASPTVRSATQTFVHGIESRTATVATEVKMAEIKLETEVAVALASAATPPKTAPTAPAAPTSAGSTPTATTATPTPAQIEKEKQIAKGVPANVLGGSGKPRYHNIDLPTRKAAEDAARRAGSGTPIEHPPHSKGGKPHFHPTTGSGKKIPGPHYNYPR